MERKWGQSTSMHQGNTWEVYWRDCAVCTLLRQRNFNVSHYLKLSAILLNATDNLYVQNEMHFQIYVQLSIICGLFTDNDSSSEYTALNSRMINFKGCGSKQSWPNLRYYPSIFLGRGWGKLQKSWTSLATLQAEIWTWDLQSMKQECCQLKNNQFYQLQLH
jgi:hypothetical protein